MKTIRETKKFRASASDILNEKWIARRASRLDRTINVFDEKSRALIATAGHSFSTDVNEHAAMPEVKHERIAATAIAAVPDMMRALVEASRALDRAQSIVGDTKESDALFAVVLTVRAALSKAGVGNGIEKGGAS